MCAIEVDAFSTMYRWGRRSTYVKFYLYDYNLRSKIRINFRDKSVVAYEGRVEL